MNGPVVLVRHEFLHVVEGHLDPGFVGLGVALEPYSCLDLLNDAWMDQVRVWQLAYEVANGVLHACSDIVAGLVALGAHG